MARSFTDSGNDSIKGSSPVSDEPLTLSCWVYPTALSTAHGVCGLYDTATGGDTFGLYVWNSGDKLLCRKQNSSDSWSEKAGVSVNAWNHIAGVFASDSSRTAYLDGVAGSEDTTSITHSETVNTTNIGDVQFNPEVDGYVAEFALWNVVLTAAEIAALAAGYSPLFIRPGSLAQYLPLIRDDDIDLISGVLFTENNSPGIAAHPPIIYPAQVYQSFAAAAAPPAGLSIPVAMHHYRQQGMSY